MKIIRSTGLVLVAFFLFSTPATAQMFDRDKMESLCVNEKNGYACLNLGESYRVLDRDKKTALKFFRLGCDVDDLTSCVHAGIIIQDRGQQYSKHWKEAAKLYEKACDQDHDKGCFNLGSLKYREGRARKALKIFKKACDLGNQVACHNYDKLNHE